MDEKQLLRSMSEIKDEYILEAGQIAAEGESPAEKAIDTASRKKARFNWKPWAACVAAAFALCIGIGSLSGGMGAAKKATPAYDSEYSYRDSGYGFNGMGKGDSAPAAPMEWAEAAPEEDYAYDAEMPAPDVTSSTFESVNSKAKSETKLVKRASLSLQTTEFEEAEKELYALVERLGGYFENADKSNGSYWSNTYYKNAYYTVRVPADKYDEFLQSVGEGCHVRNLSESVEDIGQQYFDTETRLNTLKIKLNRLNELLAKASNLSDIIQLENEISSTEYEIDSYTSTLNRYDSLVGYATINIELEQVSRVGDTIEQDNSFFAQLGRSLKNGILNFVDRLGDLINWAAFNLIGLIIIVVAIVVIRKNHLLSKFFGLFRRKKKKGDEQ